MDKRHVIFTEKNNCQDCYKCIRYCPVKAIKMESHSASIIQDRCIYCGKCTMICPVNAKKVRNDIQTAQFLLNQHKPVVLSIAPTYPLDFDSYEKEQFIFGLKSLGFSHISETAIGAEILSKEIRLWLNNKTSGVFLSSCCPTVVHLIQKYYPEHNDKIIPFLSPAQVHAKYLREIYGDINVIFAGPCISKKTELEYPNNSIDLVLSFEELNEMLQSDGLSPEFITNNKTEIFEPFEASTGKYYPVDGGMLNDIKPNINAVDDNFVSCSGLSNIKNLLDNMLSSSSTPLFVELMACQGGCVNGPGRVKSNSLVEARKKIIQQKTEDFSKDNKILIKQNISINYNFLDKILDKEYNEEDICESLATIGKLSEKDELNCGGCGYFTCRQFAKALLDGKAERQMCVVYMRKMAQNKASVLLQKMPYGVVLVDENLKIIESNKLFTKICGQDVSQAYDAKPGLEGVSMIKVTSMYRLFQNLLESGNEGMEKNMRYNGKMLHVSLFSIQKHKLVCAIVQNMDEQDMDKEKILIKLKDVIRENMQTAQEVAGLLGENASNTECLINTIVDVYQKGDNNEQNVY
ncbi:MAG: [Fe-Fe] hydrogenase large subunit C-terminal domain-containing protein [Bacteroidota bacterium]|nr:[Fe-Fe] hydrogenase large subunit C-terminal domain-containing protein [Bacteroidota bacterium]